MHNSNDARLENVRTAMDISVLRQRLWLDADGEPYEELPADKDASNILRWIDTSTMIADCLTKKMKADALWPAMHGRLDLTPTPESVLTKMRKQKLRQKTADADEEGNDLQTEAD